MAVLEKVLIVSIPALLIVAALQGRWEWWWHGSGAVAWLVIMTCRGGRDGKA